VEPSDLPSADFDLKLASGRLRARSYGREADPLVLCLPGLTANLVSLESLAEPTAAAGLRVVSLDLRGRGRSETTAAGSYGWVNHARDVLDAADALHASTFGLVGWSMGAYVAMEAANLAPRRVGRVVLIDAAGRVEAGAVELVRSSVQRLSTTYPSVDEYIALVRSVGVIQPWTELWERYFRYELEPVAGGVRSRTNREAVLEDFAYGERNDPYQLWPALVMPALLVRALRPLALREGFVVSPGDRDRFLATVSSARLIRSS
jgi:pimeloyl-ACP methyl ester carboxylesterase